MGTVTSTSVWLKVATENPVSKTNSKKARVLKMYKVKDEKLQKDIETADGLGRNIRWFFVNRQDRKLDKIRADWAKFRDELRSKEDQQVILESFYHGYWTEYWGSATRKAS